MHLSIARRLSLMIAIAVFTLLAVGITGAWVSSSLSKKLDESTNITLPAVEALDHALVNLQRGGRGVLKRGMCLRRPRGVGCRRACRSGGVDR